MYTLDKIKEDLNNISNSVGDEFDIPVEINSRLTRTLGRVISTRQNGDFIPIRMEFSKQFLETSTDECVYSVIQHEWAHYYTNKTTKEKHGHDNIFKATCALIGCTNDGTTTDVENTVSSSQVYRYQIYCPDCDEFVGGYSRKCKTITDIGNYSCAKCGCSHLEVIQNW